MSCFSTEESFLKSSLAEVLAQQNVIVPKVQHFKIPVLGRVKNFVTFLCVLVGEDGFADLAVEQEMQNYFRKAAVNLKEIIKIPGVWDVFVKCYVDVRACFTDGFLLCFPV